MVSPLAAVLHARWKPSVLKLMQKVGFSARQKQKVLILSEPTRCHSCSSSLPYPATSAARMAVRAEKHAAYKLAVMLGTAGYSWSDGRGNVVWIKLLLGLSTVIVYTARTVCASRILA